MESAGPLALIGGGEWREGCDFDEHLLAASRSNEVLVLPTAAAYEHPSRVFERAEAWFAGLGATAVHLPVVGRRDAEDADHAAKARQARFIYLSDGSALHLRSVLKGSAVWDGLVEAWRSGAVLAASSAAAMVLCDPMVDPRGGAFTLGLGLVSRLAVIPHWERWSQDKARRMAHLVPEGTAVAEIEERTALIRNPDGGWESRGVGEVRVLGAQGNRKVSDLQAIVEV